MKEQRCVRRTPGVIFKCKDKLGGIHFDARLDYPCVDGG
jgi:hypothetical protein